MIERLGLARFVVAVTMLAVSCGGGGGSGGSCITMDVTMAPGTVTIGDSTTYTAVIHNECSYTRTGMSFQGYALQGDTNRAAGGHPVQCNGGAALGDVPPGDCTSTGNFFGVSNTNAGSGTFTAGSAEAKIDLLQDADGKEIATATVPITISE